MVNCALCPKDFQDKRGLSTHVKKDHGMEWDKYNELYPQDETKRQTPPETVVGKGEIKEAKPEGTGAEIKPDATGKITPDPDPQPWEDRIGGLEKQIVGVTEAVNKLLNVFTPPLEEEKERIPKGAVPLEAVEMIGEKVNYKIALDPEIFYRWSVFKAQNARLVAIGKAKQFTGDLSDFIDLATRTLLSTFGIHPTVVTLTGGKVMMELPVDEGD